MDGDARRHEAVLLKAVEFLVFERNLIFFPNRFVKLCIFDDSALN